MAGPSATRVLRVVSAAALIAVALPLWRPLVLAAVLAGTLSQLHERLAAAVGARRSLSAMLIVASVVLILLAPLCFIAVIVVKEAPSAIAFVTHTLKEQGLAGLLAHLPEGLAKYVNDALARDSRTQRNLAAELADWPRARQALGAVAGVVGSTTHVALMAVLMLVALFFLLRDGPILIAWIESTPSMPPGRVRTLLLELRGVSKSVVGAQAASGLAQATVATIGYAVAGVPSPIVFG